MSRTCNKCNDQELIVTSTNAFRYGIKALTPLIKIEVDYACPACGQKSGTEHVITDTGEFRIGQAERSATYTGEVKHRQAMLSNSSSDSRRYTSIQFPAAYRVGENVLFPTFEGNVEDGTVIDQHGDPDLFVEFAEQYFKLYRSIMPTRRLPSSLVELMPALHLLVIAAELAFKAYLMRNDKTTFGTPLSSYTETLIPRIETKLNSIFPSQN